MPCTLRPSPSQPPAWSPGTQSASCRWSTDGKKQPQERAALFLVILKSALPAALVASRVCARELGRAPAGLLSISCPPGAPWGAAASSPLGHLVRRAGRWEKGEVTDSLTGLRQAAPPQNAFWVHSGARLRGSMRTRARSHRRAN